MAELARLLAWPQEGYSQAHGNGNGNTSHSRYSLLAYHYPSTRPTIEQRTACSPGSAMPGLVTLAKASVNLYFRMQTVADSSPQLEAHPSNGEPKFSNLG